MLFYPDFVCDNFFIFFLYNFAVELLILVIRFLGFCFELLFFCFVFNAGYIGFNKMGFKSVYQCLIEVFPQVCHIITAFFLLFLVVNYGMDIAYCLLLLLCLLKILFWNGIRNKLIS